MRILQVAPPWFTVPPTRYGGVEMVVADLVEGLVAAGHDVTLLASGGSRTSARLHTVFDEPPSTALGSTLVELAHVLALDDLGRFDVVHDHTVLGTARLALRADGPVAVHTLHGAWDPVTLAVYDRLGRDVALVAISHDQAARAHGVPLAGVVHNGIDPARYPVVVDRGDELVFLGRASPDKGPVEAIEVARRTGRPLAMAIKVNERDEHAYWHEAIVPRLGTADVRVVRDATHEEKVELLAHAHALVAPIQWDEPFGLVLVEAGACGVPVVAFARGAAPEIVRDGITGALVDQTDGVDGLCDAVDAVADVDGAACRRHVATRFSAARMVAGYLRVYERLAGTRAGLVTSPPMGQRDPR